MATKPVVPKPAVGSCSVDIALLTCYALFHPLSLAVLCALYSLVDKEMVSAVNSACTLCMQGMADTGIGNLSS